MASDRPNGAERRAGSLVVVRTLDSDLSETFVRITAEGSVTAYNGHVDLGTGIRTALGQIVAEELDVSFARVVVVLGDTAVVPNQGATIASETIQITAVPLRKAAAQARQANPNVLVLAGISTNPSGQQVTPMIYFAPSPPHATASTAIGSVFRRRPSIAQVVTASARTSQSKCSVVLPHNNTR